MCLSSGIGIENSCFGIYGYPVILGPRENI
jgi:hypothetical protein